MNALLFVELEQFLADLRDSEELTERWRKIAEQLREQLLEESD